MVTSILLLLAKSWWVFSTKNTLDRTLIFDPAQTMASVAENENYTSKLYQVLSASPAGMAGFVSALNIFLSLTASLGNVLILIALHKVSSIHPPTKLFFRCLAVTDLCVGLFVQPLFATGITSGIKEIKANVFQIAHTVTRFLSMILCGVSILTSTAISVDRLLALLLGLRYRHVVTLRRANVVIICFWLISVSVGLMGVWERDIALKTGSFFITISLVISIYCYSRIHLRLRHQQAQIQNHFPQGQQNGGGIPLNIARYRKSVSNIMWVQLALVACYVPFGTVPAVFDVNGREYHVASIATSTLVYFNSSLNPFLYCWKSQAVRRAVKVTIRQLCCF